MLKTQNRRHGKKEKQEMTFCLHCLQEVQIDKQLQAGLRVTVQLNKNENKGSHTNKCSILISDTVVLTLFSSGAQPWRLLLCEQTFLCVCFRG